MFQSSVIHFLELNNLQFMYGSKALLNKHSSHLKGQKLTVICKCHKHNLLIIHYITS